MTTTAHPAGGTTAPAKTPVQQRVDAFAADVVGRINQAIQDHDMTYEEYDAAKQWLIRVGQSGEWPLFLDVWVEHTVEELAAHSRHGSGSTILGPFYLPVHTQLPATATLPMRSDEPGDRLILRGQVGSLDGAPVSGATLDMWQADTDGHYSGFWPGVPDGNLRPRSPATTRAVLRSRQSCPAPTPSPSTGPAANCAGPPRGAPGGRVTCTSS